MAAQELKNALEAQMQAKMMLELKLEDERTNTANRLHGESSQLTDQLGTGSLMEYSASNLVCLLHLPVLCCLAVIVWCVVVVSGLMCTLLCIIIS